MVNLRGVIKIGFDLTGINPTTNDGKYFRNNSWYWRRLWDLCGLCGKLTPSQIKVGLTNDGYKIGKNAHDRILNGLMKAYSERGSDYWLDWIKYTDTEIGKMWSTRRTMTGQDVPTPTYPFSWENVKEFIKFLEGNEGFEVY